MAENGGAIHVPVLLDEVLRYLRPVKGGVYVDGTLGLGGHSEQILHQSSPDGRVIGFDWDGEAIAHASRRLHEYGERLTIVRRNFAQLAEGLADCGVSEIDGLLIDIGLSSLQLDLGERGFSFLRDEQLDMRMDQRADTTAADILARCSEEELADIFYYFGEETQSRRIASAICKKRKKTAIATSVQLSELVAEAIPRRFHPQKIHVATKVFQALRIAVNTELENLSKILDEAVDFLKPGARFCVISFHSLEDRIVKRKFQKHRELAVLTSKPVVASPEEIRCNPRSRSAKLRVAEKRI